MSSYERVNVFVGKYKVPKGGHLKLPDAAVRFIRGRETEQGWISTEDPTDPLWLIVEDGGFWAVMVRLNEAELFDMALRAPTYTSNSSTTNVTITGVTV